MSRKALFQNLGKPDGEPASETPLVGHSFDRSMRVRTRPILGSPDLISDPNAAPVGAIAQSLGEVSERSKRADDIEKRLTAGQTIVELDTSLIDPSFIADRMPASLEELSGLIDAIRDQGQINAILVRPHPDSPGRYQVAFGHRRLRALASLNKPVRAVVRDLTDEQLAIAQGQENHERKDLSYIEKVRFARRLEERFPRSTIMAAMSLYKSDLSNMLSVGSRIPDGIVDAIGPAPETGRRGWIELAQLVVDEKAEAEARKIAMSADLNSLDSDSRFKRVLAALKPSGQNSKTEAWLSPAGKSLAKVSKATDRVSIVIDRRKAPEFAEFVLTRLKDLYLEFEADAQLKP